MKCFDIIDESRRDSRDGSRKCRNWQTSKTKDLVMLTSCGFKSHLPHCMIRKSLRHKAWGFFRITHWGESLSPSGFPDKRYAFVRTRNMLCMFRRFPSSALVSHWERYSLTHSLLTVDDGLLTYHACPVDDRMATQLN